MNRPTMMRWMATTLLLAGIDGTTTVRADRHWFDLLPLSASDASSEIRYCGRDEVIVHIWNPGNAAAPETFTSVLFEDVEEVRYVRTPRIPSGQTVELRISIPDACRHIDCNFSIKADFAIHDPLGRLGEEDEQNNVVRGRCRYIPGPVAESRGR